MSASKKTTKATDKSVKDNAIGKVTPKKVPATEAKTAKQPEVSPVMPKAINKEKPSNGAFGNQDIPTIGGNGRGSGPEDVEFMDPIAASYKRKPNSGASLILYTITALVIILYFWSNWATLDEITRGEGRVVPSGQTKMVDHLEGGIVKEILIKEGDIVEKGQILLLIDNTVAKTRHEEGVTQYYNAWAQLERLRAQVAAKPFNIPDEITAKAPDVAKDEMASYQSAMQKLKNDRQIAQGEINQRQQELNEATARVETLTTNLKFAQEELDLTMPAVRQGVAPKMDGIRLKREVNEIRGELAGAKTQISRAEAALAQANQQRNQIAVNAQQEAYHELEVAERRWSEVKDLRTTGQDRLKRTDVISPVRGTVKSLLVNTTGSVVQSGEDLVEIVPLENNLVIEAEIKPSDVAFLKPGLKSKVKVTAFDFSIYGGLDADLTEISADSFKNDREQEFFRIRLKTDKNYLIGKTGDRLPISPGMTVQVDILTGSKTVWQYIMKPILKAKGNALTER